VHGKQRTKEEELFLRLLFSVHGVLMSGSRD